MNQNFKIIGIHKEQFISLLDDESKNSMTKNTKWLTADSKPGFPCRVSLVDAEVGEKVLALSFVHHDVKSPYKASGPIFIRENAESAALKVNEVPKMLRHRLLSIRAYNSEEMMIEADVTQGTELETIIEKQFQNNDVKYIHIHNANPGCFNCAVHRA